MAVLASDDFNRADNATLGANWGAVTGLSNPAIVSNRADIASGGIYGTRYTAVSAPANQYAKIKVVTVSPDSDTGWGPAVRMASGAITMYFAQCSTVEIKLYKVVASAFTQLGSDAAAAASNDVIEIDANGTSITVKKNGATVIGPITDSAIASGSWGFWAAGANAIHTTGDDWEGGDFTGAAVYTKGNFLGFM